MVIVKHTAVVRDVLPKVVRSRLKVAVFVGGTVEVNDVKSKGVKKEPSAIQDVIHMEGSDIVELLVVTEKIAAMANVLVMVAERDVKSRIVIVWLENLNCARDI